MTNATTNHSLKLAAAIGIPPELLDLITAHEGMLTAAVAGGAAVLLYGVLGRRWLGADDTFWNALRRTLLPWLDTQLDGSVQYASYELDSAEFVGTVDLSLAEVNRKLDDLGADRMPIAAFKYAPGGRPEAASWAFRDLPDAFDSLPPAAQVAVAMLQKEQLHVILFERPDGRADIAVHHEANAINPETASEHYRGDEYDIEKGNDEFVEIWRETGVPLVEWQPVEKKQVAAR